MQAPPSPQGYPSLTSHRPRHSASVRLQEPSGQLTVSAGQPSTPGHSAKDAAHKPSEQRTGEVAGHAAEAEQADRAEAHDPSAHLAGDVEGQAGSEGHVARSLTHEPSAH